MRSMIHLGLGRLEVDWGKNSFFADHGTLFQDTDIKPVPSYYACDDGTDGEPIIRMNKGFGKPLRQILARLNLLGHTLRAVKHDYDRLHRLHKLDKEVLPFDHLRQALAQVHVNEVSADYSNDYDPGEFASREIQKRLALHLPGFRKYDSEAGLLLENLGANSVLRLLAENPENLNLDVTWDITPLIESGWAKQDEFRAELPPEKCFLVVTEGSSDAKIIKKALQLFRPYISDFFRFVDMEEGYPFSGTGNLHKFTQGLISIAVQNNTVIVYDNDAEGIAKMQTTKKLSIPPNMRVMKLPDMSEFSNFKTIGPTGTEQTDINGRAAAIECFLDLNRDGLTEPIVRWTAFNKDLDLYHGELQQKAEYMKDFLNLRTPSASYKSNKIESLIDALVMECVSIAEHKLTNELI